MRRATASLLFLVLVLCGVGSRPLGLLLLCQDGRVHARCCCGSVDERVRDGERSEGLHAAFAAEVGRGSMDCCEALPEASPGVSVAAGPAHDEGMTLAANAFVIATTPWVSSPRSAAASSCGSPATGPPLYRKHCSLLL